MSALARTRKKYEYLYLGPDKTDKSPSVGFVSSSAGVSENSNPRPERHREALERLSADPTLTHVWKVDPDLHPEYVVVTVAIRGVGTAELSIPKGRYNPETFLLLTEKWAR